MSGPELIDLSFPVLDLAISGGGLPTLAPPPVSARGRGR